MSLAFKMADEVRKYQEQVISEGCQDSPLSEEELNARVRDFQQEREASHNERLREMEKHPRCALLPSPEKLNELFSPGSDVTDTIKDFELVTNWVKEKKFLNADFYDHKMQMEALFAHIPELIENLKADQQNDLETEEFGYFINIAFNNAFAAMRNTASPELDELVFWYYAGHGLGKEKAETQWYSSTPLLSEVGLNPNDNDAANKYVKEDRKVKGGELYLHKYGFCDLYGLLKPWIAAVKAESNNAKGATKKNKHLVIILDSCHSGIIAQELEEFQKHAQEIDPSLLAENSITIQAACGPDERTFGGYFTPCFVYLNDPKNAEFLKGLKDQWEAMEEQEKAKYIESDFPSPMVVTTRPQSSATMEVEVQNFKLTLFQDPGFFKFCLSKVYQLQDINFLEEHKDRVLNVTSANAFMSSGTFTILDYKLKTYQGKGADDPHAGTPMALFLLEDPANPGFAVCAHIHFDIGNTNTHKRINLVHHKKQPMGSALFVEDDGGLSAPPTVSGHHKIPVTHYPNAANLVTACRQYVDKNEPGRWQDVKRWKMTGLGVNSLFRLKERSAGEEEYLNCIEKLDLPKVTNTL